MDQEEAVFAALERHAQEQAARHRKVILQILVIIILLACFIAVLALACYSSS